MLSVRTQLGLLFRGAGTNQSFGVCGEGLSLVSISEQLTESHEPVLKLTFTLSNETV